MNIVVVRVFNKCMVQQLACFWPLSRIPAKAQLEEVLALRGQRLRNRGVLIQYLEQRCGLQVII